MKPTPAVLGMDMGGTNLRLGVVDGHGSVRQAMVSPLPDDTSVAVVTADIIAKIRALGEWCRDRRIRVEAVCLSAPGIIEAASGVIVFSPNLPGWRDVPLRDIIASAVGLPVKLENDANAAAFGEFWKGAGGGCRDMLMFTLGTGVGGGIIAGGRLVRGHRGMAGELGHVTVVSPGGRPCKCGNNGCLEAYSSASAIVGRIAETVRGGAVPKNAREAAERALSGDAVCRQAFADAGACLGVAMADVTNILNPEAIIVGGGVAEAWDLIMPSAEAEMRRRSFASTDMASRVAVRRAELGNMAGVIGAAGLFFTGAAA